ncbi:general secretion pathway protein GspJ [Mesorhizobium australicum]|uniref:hypothetical protein n=1 Tax=Mesorhizobium australicum TaxID=536018 RepID=UPI0033375B31
MRRLFNRCPFPRLSCWTTAKAPTLSRSKVLGDEGFALIDVLVGLAMVGVITSLMMVFLGQARTITRIDNAAQMQMEVDAATRFLEATMSNAQPLPLPQADPDDANYFIGQANEVRFNGILAIGFKVSALRDITILLGEGGHLFVVEKPRRGANAKAAPKAENVPLIGGVSGVAFEYLDGSKGSWSKVWRISRRMPFAVRFQISVVRDGFVYSSNGFARLKLSGSEIQPSL